MSKDMSQSQSAPLTPLTKVIPRPNDPVIKRGILVLLTASGIRQEVFVCVYRTSKEHFAVIYPGKRSPRPMGVVNLRKTIAEREDSCCGFTLRQTGFDNALSAEFKCAKRDIDSWLTALSPLAQQDQQARMPVVFEMEEQ